MAPDLARLAGFSIHTGSAFLGEITDRWPMLGSIHRDLRGAAPEPDPMLGGAMARDLLLDYAWRDNHALCIALDRSQDEDVCGRPRASELVQS